MSAKPTPKQLKSILKTRVNATKRVRLSKDAHVEVNPSPKRSSKSKGKQPDGAAFAEPPPNAKPKKERSQPKASSSATQPPAVFKLIAGSYEKLLYGLEGSITLGEEDEDQISVNLKPIFIFPAHVSCVKAVSGSPMGGKWLATGSIDEIVKVWDLRRRKEVGGLMQHEGEHLVTQTVEFIFSHCIRFHYRTALPLAISSHFGVRRWNDSYFPRTRLGSATGLKGT